MPTEAELLVARQAGYLTPAGQNLIRDGDDAISQNAVTAHQAAAAGRYDRGVFPLDGNLTTLHPGAYDVRTYAVAQSVQPPLPPEALAGGSLIVSPGTTYRSVEFVPVGISDRPLPVWRNEFNVNLDPQWQGWHRVDAAALLPDLDGLVEGTDPRLSDARTPTAHGHDQADVAGLGSALDAATWWRGAAPLTTHADEAGSGVYAVWTSGTALSLGLPTEMQGILESFRYGNSGGVQRWNTRSIDFPLEVWQRQRFSTVWDEWQRIDAGGIEIPAPGAGGSGFKTIPLAVTLGNSGTSDAPSAQTVRYALHFNAPVTRWRLHVANRNARSGSTRPGNVDFAAWQLGTEGAGGAIQSPQTVIPAFSTDGTGWASQWITAPIGTDTPLLLGTSYTSTVPPILQVGACWSGATPSTLARQANAPFEVWIEAETPATTPVVAVLGSSSDAGVGSTRPVVDSTIARWARTHGALPVHYAHSGDAMSASTDPSAHKWARWSHLDRPDSVLFALGSNDVYGTATLSDMQDRHAQVAGIAATVISPVQYGATVYQRANGEDPDRTPYNTWIKGMPNGLRDVFDFAAAIGSPPDPAFDADGIHLNDAGLAALLAAITGPLTPPRRHQISLDTDGIPYFTGV